jgi:hypothetical protein
MRLPQGHRAAVVTDVGHPVIHRVGKFRSEPVDTLHR